MSSNPFPYPGGKSYLARWIVSHFPRHRTYVEPFFGSGAVLFEKEPSSVEVVNDLDGDIVEFFEVLRDEVDELEEWLRNVPFARDVHEEWSREYYQGVRPDDKIERVGRWFFLRHSQYASKYRTRSGFASARLRNQASRYQNKIDELELFSERLRHVQIESLDFEEFIRKFDGEGVLFYCDPPYVEAGDTLYSHSGSFDHDSLVKTLSSIEGDYIVSYESLPPLLNEVSESVVARDYSQFMNKGQEERREEAVERLALSFDPSDVECHIDCSQTRLMGWSE